MKAIRKEPGCAPELIDIDNTLKALQTEVGRNKDEFCDVPETDFLMDNLREGKYENR